MAPDSFKINTVTAALAAFGPSISVLKADGTTGAITILDSSAMASSINQEDCPVLAPNPDNFVTNLTAPRITFGGDASKKDWVYTLNYIFYYCPALEAPDLFSAYGDMVTAFAAILLYVMDNTQSIGGCVDFIINGVPYFGKQSDVTGTNFHGAKIAFAVKQYMEA